MIERDPARHDRMAVRAERWLERTRRRIGHIAAARLIAFIVAGVFGFAAWHDNEPFTYGPVGLLGAIAFGVAIWRHRRPFALAPRLEALTAIHRHTAARLRGDWAALPDDGVRYLDSARPELAELQVFGRASLYSIVNRASLPAARDRLAALLADGLPPDELPDRQAAARELAPLEGFRRRLEAEGRLVDFDASALARFFAWAEEKDPGPVHARWLAKIARLLVPATLIQCVLTGAFEIPTAWSACLLVQAIIYGVTTRGFGRWYGPLVYDERFRPFVALRRMFALVERRKFQSVPLAALHTTLTADAARRPSRVMRDFERITDGLAARHNALMFFILNVLGLWELFYVARIVDWRARHGAHVRAHLDTLADFEVLCAMGGFAWDRPGYAWPEVRDGEPVLEAKGVGHPLIPVAVRRCNDFRMSRGRLVLITGSNMSGKSSFLRTLGASVRLALAGAPVCADSFALTDCRLSTSIQVTDAPEQGLSLFYAEVKRIRTILEELAEAEADPSRPPRLYLVDEMLRGTNSRERHLASVAVARTVLDAGRSYGLVTTHDLGLVSLAETFGDRIETRHFTDRVDGRALHFDYRLRDGVAATTNALAILRMEGIDVPDEPAPDADRV